jgi:hypothetical protein
MVILIKQFHCLINATMQLMSFHTLLCMKSLVDCIRLIFELFKIIQK